MYHSFYSDNPPTLPLLHYGSLKKKIATSYQGSKAQLVLQMFGNSAYDSLQFKTKTQNCVLLNSI